MGKKVYGLTIVKSGNIANDGGMGTTLTELLGATVKGSGTLTFTPPGLTDLEIEEVDDVWDEVPSSLGKWELKLDSYAVSAATMYKLFGGTFTPAVTGGSPSPAIWGMPAVFVPIEQSIQMTTRSGEVLAAPRMKLMPAPNFATTKSDAFKLSLTGTILSPTKANTPSLTFTDAPTG
jgi:hypothetical protein